MVDLLVLPKHFIPEIDYDIGLMHTPFALEDLHGLQTGEIDGEMCLRLGKSKGMTYVGMLELFMAWTFVNAVLRH